MLKKKSTIFALIGVLMFAAAMYFMYHETRETYDIGDFIDDEPEPEEIEEIDEPEPETKPTVSDESNTAS